VGKQITMLINLAPRKMMGIDSEGMILMAEGKDGKLKLLQPGLNQRTLQRCDKQFQFE
jgi:methionyl-tRNA synthetase